MTIATGMNETKLSNTMRINRDQITSMLEMQSGMNSKVNPAWLDAGYPFLRAVVVEGGEAMDHKGWKWWKHQEADLSQVQMELVDIWHFLLSAILIEARGDIKAAAEWVEKRITALDGQEARKAWIFEKEYRLDNMDPIEKLELLIGFSVFRKISIPLFDAILEDCQMSWQDLFRQYIGKNVLNFFRQDFGYKTGSYRKHWHDGREDNVHLVEILAELNDDSDNFKEKLYAAMQVRYEIGGSAQ